jgi:gas vesicle protein
MNKVKSVFYTVMSGVLLGVILGVLFAPDEGAETRRKFKKLRQRFACAGRDDDQEALEELKDTLQTELKIINKRIDK